MKTFGIKVQITKFVNNSQPGFVECEFTDAHGIKQKFIDKAPVFTSEQLSENSAYPLEGILNFAVIEKNEQIVKINTARPWGITSIDDKAEFEIRIQDLIEFDT